ncbi:ORF33-like protein [Bufonid herpesvirus 1]|uniref:ORF33-like protein n=1 Tax=Bufonid herpesvirus 1 TaxID=2282206 RepID=UPI000EB77CEB|nr:ORF33-like protein [Bufonid herpesvirus 1]AXF48621.1 ORF33-like protein [Bufonid herpesvirus 1]
MSLDYDLGVPTGQCYRFTVSLPTVVLKEDNIEKLDVLTPVLDSWRTCMWSNLKSCGKPASVTDNLWASLERAPEKTQLLVLATHATGLRVFQQFRIKHPKITFYAQLEMLKPSRHPAWILVLWGAYLSEIESIESELAELFINEITQFLQPTSKAEVTAGLKNYKLLVTNVLVRSTGLVYQPVAINGFRHITSLMSKTPVDDDQDNYSSVVYANYWSCTKAMSVKVKAVETEQNHELKGWCLTGVASPFNNSFLARVVVGQVSLDMLKAHFRARPAHSIQEFSSIQNRGQSPSCHTSWYKNVKQDNLLLFIEQWNQKTFHSNIPLTESVFVLDSFFTELKKCFHTLGLKPNHYTNKNEARTLLKKLLLHLGFRPPVYNQILDSFNRAYAAMYYICKAVHRVCEEACLMENPDDLTIFALKVFSMAKLYRAQTDGIALSQIILSKKIHRNKKALALYEHLFIV